MSCCDCLTVADVAARLKVSGKTVRRLIWAGKLRGVKVGGAVRVTEEAILCYLGENKIGRPVKEPPDAQPKRGRREKGPSISYRFFPPP